MSQRVEKLGVLFADICGSTALYEELGDDAARRLIADCIGSMSRACTAHQGTVVKTIGDEVMCTFPTVEAAFHSSCAMQQAVRDERPRGSKPLFIRVGFHFGDVILEPSGDVFGDTVNTAARVAAITRPGEIMITQSTNDVLPPELKEKVRHVMRTDFKGKQDQLDIFLVIWEQDDLMSTRIMKPAARKVLNNDDELRLKYRDKSFTVNKVCRGVMLGRGENCDMIVPNTLASRQHVRIEWRGGKFVIIDQSTNGTYIRPSGGTVVQITREETYLHGNGSISLGHSYADNPTELVEFSIVPAASQ